MEHGQHRKKKVMQLAPTKRRHRGATAKNPNKMRDSNGKRLLASKQPLATSKKKRIITHLEAKECVHLRSASRWHLEAPSDHHNPHNCRSWQRSSHPRRHTRCSRSMSSNSLWGEALGEYLCQPNGHHSSHKHRSWICNSRSCPRTSRCRTMSNNPAQPAQALAWELVAQSDGALMNPAQCPRQRWPHHSSPVSTLHSSLSSSSAANRGHQPCSA